MGPKKNKTRPRLGVTLIEILVAMAALVIAVLGTSYFRYYSALDARKDAHRYGDRSVLLVVLSSRPAWCARRDAVLRVFEDHDRNRARHLVAEHRGERGVLAFEHVEDVSTHAVDGHDAGPDKG